TARFKEGRIWIAHGLAAADAAGETDLEPLANLLGSAANVTYGEGKFDEALDYDRRALAIREKIEKPGSILLAEAHSNLGRELTSLGKFAEAEAELRSGLALYEAQLGPTHPSVAFTLNNLGALLQATGRLDDALAAFRKSAAAYEDS